MLSMGVVVAEWRIHASVNQCNWKCHLPFRPGLKIVTVIENTRIGIKQYDIVIMSVMAYQSTGVSMVYSVICSGADHTKHQSSASLAFVRGIRRLPVNSPCKGPVPRKMFSFDDVIRKKAWNLSSNLSDRSSQGECSSKATIILNAKMSQKCLNADPCCTHSLRTMQQFPVPANKPVGTPAVRTTQYERILTV